MDSRIVTNPGILSGKPCVRGTRISVELILEWIASGASTTEIVATYPQLSSDDVRAAVEFAARFLRDTETADVELAR